MGRRQRELVKGGWYHLFNRGAARSQVFLDDHDRWAFYSILGDQVVDGHLEVHAWVLMGNHFHLLVSSESGRVEVAMRDLGRRYTRQFNGRHDRDGPLFRGRYQSRRLKTSRYRRAVLGYIEQNPVKDGFAREAVEYPWGSAHCRARKTYPHWASFAWAEEQCPGQLPGEFERAIESQLVSPFSSTYLLLEESFTSAAALRTRMDEILTDDAEHRGGPSWTAIGSQEALSASLSADSVGGEWHRDLEIALSRIYAGDSLGSLARRSDVTQFAARQSLETHRNRVLQDPNYKALCVKVLSSAAHHDLALLGPE